MFASRCTVRSPCRRSQLRLTQVGPHPSQARLETKFAAPRWLTARDPVKAADDDVRPRPHRDGDRDRDRACVPARARGPGCWGIHGENDFIADGKEVFRTDALGWRKRRLPRPPATGRVGVIPDWVCEVLSPTDRAHDLRRKRDAYARVGVRYRWYRDPESQVLQSFELRRGQWIELGACCGGDFARTAPFDAVELVLGDWWLARVPRR
jgi:hypothetical protein